MLIHLRWHWTIVLMVKLRVAVALVLAQDNIMLILDATERGRYKTLMYLSGHPQNFVKPKPPVNPTYTFLLEVIAHCHLPSNSSGLELTRTQSINVQYLCWGLGENLEQAVTGTMPSPSMSATGYFPASAAFRHQSPDIPPHAAASQNGLRPLLVTMSSTFCIPGFVFPQINS